MITHFRGPGLRVTQRNKQFCYVPIQSKQMAEVLDYREMHWDPNTTSFAGFNRDIDPSHVKEIVEGLAEEGVIMPNPIIGYFLPLNFKFTPNPASAPPIEAGQIEILVTNRENMKVGFVIDGQHRVEALRRRQLEQGEEDIVVGLVAFSAPQDVQQRAAFEEFVLNQMAIINSAKPLSQNEELLVQQRIDKVMVALGLSAENTANLIVKGLDSHPNSVVRFTAQDKKPPAGETWLALSVWVKVITHALESQNTVGMIFNHDYHESVEKRTKAQRVFYCYFAAIAELVKDMALWQASTKNQRLYHNVGLYALVSFLDGANAKANAFSRVDHGKLNKVSETEAIKAFKKALKVIRLVDWGVGLQDPAHPDDVTSLKMASVQNQRGIPGNLAAALRALVDAAHEIQDQGGTYDKHLEIKDTSGLLVSKQRICFDKSALTALDRQIDDGHI